jgi:hypothetical protein
MLASIFVLASLPAAEKIRSGPPVGEQLPSMFHPFNVTGDDAGKEQCLI